MDVKGVVSSTSAGVLGSPLRNLAAALIFVVMIFVLATLGYLAAGWSLGDAAYMVTLTIFSVGYDEVHPINTAFLRILTTGTIALGCTGMIVLTGALIQVFTDFQLRQMLGFDRMQTQIDKLENHVIICGFGRIGVQLANELHTAQSGFVVIEREERKIAEAQGLGYLCITADATEESALHAAGIKRARVLATVLPNDAANVFITLSARNLNDKMEIIARGEAPSTESKLFHAGANKVVLPTHIGAERIAEMILYPSTTQFVRNSPEMRDMKRGLHEFGLELEVVVIPADSAMIGETVGEAERRGKGAFFVVQIDRANGPNILHPGEDVRIVSNDKIIIVARGSRVSAGAIFSAPKGRVRAGRLEF
ncbi:MAG: potassium channel family protein [Candidatus Promineifilaceae bacterium]